MNLKKIKKKRRRDFIYSTNFNKWPAISSHLRESRIISSRREEQIELGIGIEQQKQSDKLICILCSMTSHLHSIFNLIDIKKVNYETNT